MLYIAAVCLISVSSALLLLGKQVEELNASIDRIQIGRQGHPGTIVSELMNDMEWAARDVFRSNKKFLRDYRSAVKMLRYCFGKSEFTRESIEILRNVAISNGRTV